MIRINPSLCNNCAICGDVCPLHIPITTNKNGQKQTHLNLDRIGLCLNCGHCAALCPSQAIEVESLYQETFDPIVNPKIDDLQLLSLFQQRRSIRNYKNKPVFRKKIDRIIDAARSAPTGTASSVTGIIVIDDPEKLAEFSELIYTLYESLEYGLNHPVGQRFVRRKVKKYAGEKNLRALEDFVMPKMHWYIQWFRAGKSNEILRDCPVLMLFHNPAFEPMGQGNCLIAAFQAVLMAQVLGIGTCFTDLLPLACNSPRVPEIKKFLGLSDDREVYASLTVGYPKYRFQRSIPKKLAEVRHL